MKTINPLKLGVWVGVLNVVFPLTGFPQFVKTSVVILSGLVLLYVCLVALHHTKIKKPIKRAVRRSQVFSEGKPLSHTEEIEEVSTEKPYVE